MSSIKVSHKLQLIHQMVLYLQHKLVANAVTTAKVSNDAITNAKIASGAVDATELASSLNLSSKTLTMPQKFNGLQHIITVNPVGTNAFVQDLSSYEQVMVFYNNVDKSQWCKY